MPDPTIVAAWMPPFLALLIVLWALNRMRRVPRLPSRLSGPGDSITIGRARQYSALLRRLVVIIDGAAVGRIRAGEVMHFAVAPGTHAVTVKIDWCTATPLQVEKHAHRNVAIRCGVKANVAALFRPRDYAYVSDDG